MPAGDDQHQRGLAQDRNDVVGGIELRHRQRNADGDDGEHRDQNDLVVARQGADEAHRPGGVGELAHEARERRRAE